MPPGHDISIRITGVLHSGGISHIAIFIGVLYIHRHDLMSFEQCKGYIDPSKILDGIILAIFQPTVASSAHK